MKSFQFNLSRVLDVRNLEEKIARNILLQEKHKANTIEDELEQLNNKQQKVYNYLRENRSNIINDETLQFRSFLHRHRQKITQVEKGLSQQLAEVEVCNSAFIEKKQNKEILENLKEKDYQQYRKDLLRKEQQLTDEMNQQIKGARWFE